MLASAELTVTANMSGKLRAAPLLS